jgi:nucleoside-diphosphate-sugar epimerase
VVEATVRAIDGAEVGEAYNIGGGASLTVNQAIAILAEAIGIEPIVERGPVQPGDQRHTMADTAKARKTFGYGPVVEPTEGLRRQVDWHRSRRANP